MELERYDKYSAVWQLFFYQAYILEDKAVERSLCDMYLIDNTDRELI